MLIAVVMDRISAGFATSREAPRDRWPLIAICAAVAVGLLAQLIGLETPSNVGWVRDLGVNITLRETRGRDIDAACGQLRIRAATSS